MAGVSDKARFYLERSIPELQELERKEVFSKARIFVGLSMQIANALARLKSRPLLRSVPTLNTRLMLVALFLRIMLAISSTKSTSIP